MEAGVVWHPTEAIKGSASRRLQGRCILVGVTGSVAAYKAIDTARWLVRRGASVRFVATREALEFVGEKLLHWASGEPPITGLSGEVEHITHALGCDGMLVAPCTLSTLVKISLGITDNPVALTAVSILGTGKPLVVSPAMHANMMNTPQYREAVRRLEGHTLIVPPRVEEGVAKYPDPLLLARIVAALVERGRDMAGLRVLVTAGATREWLDPVRYITNPSSGLMGYELAVAAWARGAKVYLVHGNMRVDPPHVTENIRVETTADMRRAVERIVDAGVDIVIASAAPVDFTPERRVEAKIRSGSPLDLRLVPTPKVVEGLSDRVGVLVVFAAETASEREDLVRSGLEKMDKYGADIVVANRVGTPTAGFSADALDAVIIWRHGGRVIVEDLGNIKKDSIAQRILDTALLKLRGGPGG